MKSLATNNIDGRAALSPPGLAPLLMVHARHPHRRSTKATQATAMTSAAQHGSRIVSYCLDNETLLDLGGIVVVTGALLIYGVLQERIVTIGFGSKLEVFDHSIFLVLCNRLITCILALAYLAATRTPVLPGAPLRSYAAVSLTNVIATSCQYEALRYVSFAVQTLAKSAKALPVMLWGMVYLQKRYKLTEFFHATCITLGCSVFLLTGKVTSRVAEAAAAKANAAAGHLGLAGGAGTLLLSPVVTGGALMLLYLLVDGLTSTWQDSMFHGYPVSVCDQVLYTTACSMVLSLVGTIATDQLMPSLRFLARNPEALWWILWLSLASAVVQLVISWTIKRYGAVVFATIMTTRQFFSILLSSVVFMTPLTLGQWGGTLLVFGAIYYKAVQKCAEHKQMTASKMEDEEGSTDDLPAPDDSSTNVLKAPLLPHDTHLTHTHVHSHSHTPTHGSHGSLATHAGHVSHTIAHHGSRQQLDVRMAQDDQLAGGKGGIAVGVGAGPGMGPVGGGGGGGVAGGHGVRLLSDRHEMV